MTYGIHKRGRIWWCDFTVNGVRTQRSLKPAETRKQAIKSAKDLWVKAHQPTPKVPEVPQMTLKQAVDRMYRERWQDSSANRGGDRYVKRVLRTDVWDPDTILLSELTTDRILRARTQLRDSGLSAGSINAFLTLLKAVLKRAHQYWGVLEAMPIVEKLREDEPKTRWLTEQEISALLAATSSVALRHFILILIDTGLRINEALSLTAEDIDLDHKVITVRAEHAKSKKSRVIPMTQRVHTIFHWHPEGLGSSESQIREYWAVAKKAAGLGPEVTPHTLRHTFASRLVQAGESLFVVQKLLGHADIKQTMRYAHLRTESLEGAISKLEQYS